MCLHLSVILFTWGGLPQCMLGCTPPPMTRGRHPTGIRGRPPPRQEADPPTGTDPSPREQCMLGDTSNKRAVRILLECILVYLYLYSDWKVIRYLNDFMMSVCKFCLTDHHFSSFDMYKHSRVVFVTEIPSTMAATTRKTY